METAVRSTAYFFDEAWDADKVDAVFYVLVKPWAVYVKEGIFFRQQGGLTKAWGIAWRPIAASSLDEARAIGEKMQQEGQL